MKEKVINKKSYNPFKMWGSWVGLIIGLLLFILIISISASNEYDKRLAQYEIQKSCVSTLENECVIMYKPSLIPLFFTGLIQEKSVNLFHFYSFRFLPYGYYLSYIVFYLLPLFTFLIGWAIHSLIRKYKK